MKIKYSEKEIHNIVQEYLDDTSNIEEFCRKKQITKAFLLTWTSRLQGSMKKNQGAPIFSDLETMVTTGSAIQEVNPSSYAIIQQYIVESLHNQIDSHQKISEQISELEHENILLKKMLNETLNDIKELKEVLSGSTT